MGLIFDQNEEYFGSFECLVINNSLLKHELTDSVLTVDAMANCY